MTGFVKAHRVRFEHHLFKAEPWCRGYAWDWMVSQAAWRDHRVSIKGRTIAIRRGQFTASVRYMADRFGWGKSSVDRFLTRLKAEAMIGTSTDDGQLVITICNYDRYQSIDDNGEVSTGTASGTRTGQEQDKVEELKDSKEKKEQQHENQPSKADDLTTRERLLAAMGADPISGVIGPNGKRLGTVADTVEAERWVAMGLSIEKQCAVIAERCAAMRRTNSYWTPGRFTYFTGAMQDLIAAGSRREAALEDNLTAAKIDRWNKIAAAR